MMYSPGKRQAQPIASPILAALPDEARTRLVQRSRHREYAAGSTLFFKGDEGSWLFWIEEGMVEISVLSPQGKKAILNHLGCGELIGEIAALDQLPRSADAIALTDTRGIVISKSHLADILSQDAEACLDVIRLLCGRVRNASDMFENRAVASAPVRLSRCLLKLVEKWGQPDKTGSVRITQAFSQADLGDFAGLARENVNRLLRDWQVAGWIEFHRGEITVHDLDALEDLLDGDL